jgi:hypothetical protein
MAERRRWREWLPLRDVRQYLFRAEALCRGASGWQLRDHHKGAAHYQVGDWTAGATAITTDADVVSGFVVHRRRGKAVPLAAEL